MKQIIVNVSGLTIEEKQRVNEALAKVTGVGLCSPAHWDNVDTMYGQSVYGDNVGFGYYEHQSHTHTPQQVLEMAGMAKQGHVHAENMALYAEDAKTTDKPWELWQIKAGSSDWISCKFSPAWDPSCQFRRKPKTHIVNGVEIPDLRVTPEIGDKYYLADPASRELTELHTFVMNTEKLWVERGLTYQNTEEGKQAAILHSKAMLIST